MAPTTVTLCLTPLRPLVHLPRDSVIQMYLMTLAARSIHLMVRIQDSQSWHRGSIPLSTTKYRCKS